jgi:hypothetical protein
MDRHKHRRHLLADSRSQIRLALLMVMALLIYTIIMLAVILAPSVIGFMSPGSTPEEQLEASQEFLFLDKRVVPFVLLVMVLVGLHLTFFTTHRVFGPLLRFKRILGQWGEGRWPGEFHARPKDFHGDLFDVFNRTVGVLRTEVLQAQVDLASAREVLGKARREGGQISGAELEAVDEACARSFQALNRFRPVE